MAKYYFVASASSLALLTHPDDLSGSVLNSSKRQDFYKKIAKARAKKFGEDEIGLNLIKGLEQLNVMALPESERITILFNYLKVGRALKLKRDEFLHHEAHSAETKELSQWYFILHLLLLAEVSRGLVLLPNQHQRAFILEEMTSQVGHLLYWIVVMKADQVKEYQVEIKNLAFVTKQDNLDQLWSALQNEAAHLFVSSQSESQTKKALPDDFSWESPLLDTDDDTSSSGEIFSPLFSSSSLTNSPNIFFGSPSTLSLEGEELKAEDQAKAKQLEELTVLKLSLIEAQKGGQLLGLEDLPLTAIDELFSKADSSTAAEVNQVYQLVRDFYDANDSLKKIHELFKGAAL